MSEQSKHMKEYFDSIDNELKKAYEHSEKARNKSLDPEDTVAIPLAKNMAERVEGLISVVEPKIKGSGISKRINELELKHGKLSWKVACVISLETAQQKFCKFDDKLKAMELGIRVGLAYLTLGVVASPLEGFVELILRKRLDNGKEYFCLMFSGPIRSAGGTAAAVSVVVADYIRKHMNYATYDPTELEIKRSVTELYDYHDRITNLQYLPSEDEIAFMAKNIPVQISGDASEKIEVSNYKDLKRIDTNIIRNGFCLVMGECLCQKAAKLSKQLSEWGEEFGLEQWSFITDFVKLQKTKKAKKLDGSSDMKLAPDYTFIKDIVAGRPILGFPLRNGGFRLRYGRSRNTGLSSAAIHPATTYILDKFIAIGTQLKLERPGKAASMSVCDTIEGPIVKLMDGTVQRINDIATAKEVTKKVKEILYLGDILINYGDFFNRAHKLVPAGYCEEWWVQEIKKNTIELLGSFDTTKLAGLLMMSTERITTILHEIGNPTINSSESLIISDKLNVPLPPKFTYYWNALSKEEFYSLFKELSSANIIQEENIIIKVIIPFNEEIKHSMELCGIPHKLINNEFMVILGDDARILSTFIKSIKHAPIPTNHENMPNNDLLNISIKHTVRDKCGIFIGARMGRPEKAKVRKMDGQPHCLFPVGDEGGRLRSFQSSIEAGKVTSDFPMNRCKCGNDTVFRVCEQCGQKTKKLYFCLECAKEGKGTIDKPKCARHGEVRVHSIQSIDIKKIFKSIMSGLDLDQFPELIKGVKGTSNKDHVPEHLSKGILRSKYSIPVNKDGTTRYDMTQLAITHFKPSEIGASIESLRNLGYTQDIHNEPITKDDQILELFPQDLILPKCIDAMEEGADEVLYRVAKFIDDLLVKHYKLDSYYKLKSKSDLAGKLVIALAPHTSAGIIGRIIGFSDTQGFYAHPLFHAATRRDCDGDEACVTLLVDALLNFSRQYLPNSRGATQDAPLVLTSKLIPSEVDDMAFDVDVCWNYPLEFYEATLEYKEPWDFKFDQIGTRLNTEEQYEGTGFTHNTESINHGVKCSAYKLLPSMQEKLRGQMDLAVKIRAVDESTVAKTVIEKHFIKDIKGNLRKFSQQQFRCVKCNEKYRRPPLIGKCTRCGGKIIFTISEGSIVKYLEPALSLANHYEVPKYLKQSLELTKKRVESVFGKDKEKQEGLGRWFG